MFNVRVYGIYEQQGRILVSDERIKGQRITKFPGGGLQEGEGTRDCLIREWDEELHQRVAIGDHLYTTDFYQQSGFGDGSQVIAIYYAVHPLEPLQVPLAEEPFVFRSEQPEAESFRMIPWDRFSESDLSLPIDRIVARMIIKGRR